MQSLEVLLKLLLAVFQLSIEIDLDFKDDVLVEKISLASESLYCAFYIFLQTKENILQFDTEQVLEQIRKQNLF